jgi:coenzyme F420-reducing hydrogenase beta subunit
MIYKNKILKEKCTGCCACANICPQNAIKTEVDREGFYFPVVNKEKCIQCGLCLGVCPVLNKQHNKNKISQKIYACKSLDHKNKIASSSGGLFSEFSEKIINQGGVVFGANFQKGIVKHIYIERKEDLYLLRGSKYLQSFIGNSFKDVMVFLKNKRLVFFTGTPCQIAGLKLFLKKNKVDISYLFCADLVCHGVPSYLLFQENVKKISKGKFLKNVYFRNKRFGWKNFSLIYIFKDGLVKRVHFQMDYFMRGFSKNYYLRRSCYDCLFSKLPRQGDVTLGDFWGVPQKDYDYNGVSAILINNKKGKRFFEKIKKSISFNALDPEVAYKSNPSFKKNFYEKNKRKVFFDDYFKKGYDYVVKKYLKPDIKKVLIIWMKTIKNIILKK